MAVHRRGARARGRAAAGILAAVAVLAPALLAGCAPPPRPDTTAADVQRLLDLRARALLDRDERGYLEVLDPAATGLRAAERRQFTRLARVPLGSWAYRLGPVGHRAGGRVVAGAELSYRLAGHDPGPVTTGRELELARDAGGGWRITADRPAPGAAEQLWQQGDVQVVRGGASLVLGVGQPAARLRAIARTADRSVPAVARSWPSPWAGRVVVLVPRTLDDMGALLGAPAAGYRGIAAVTTGATGTREEVPADRVIVNPAAYGALGDFGKQIVLTHETAHVATRTHTSGTTPMWLSEGFADWVAYRGSGRTAGRIAPELQRAVRRGQPPAVLPADADFSFTGDADALARAYEGGWLACELIAGRWGERKLIAFYREAARSPLPVAFSRVLGTTPESFTTAWRAYLTDRLSP
ncbi:hypothetical protein [Streptomyces yaizuensis]|uniref:Basic secretory family protein n=1 Tax=Streptomyces yaizuensis TaxID=2989713 RepID=A0ABQ5NUU0_9ACTN|nr:hypothetical protein [Streptomyces sp. YSPA8]GLF94135.1 basic secretory family protein [Streptomyces sp. YSPA8]